MNRVTTWENLNMPADYKYEFITKGRMKALDRARSDIFALHQDMKKSGMIAPEILSRLKVICALVNRAANGPMDEFSKELLEKLFGKDLGEQRNF